MARQLPTFQASEQIQPVAVTPSLAPEEALSRIGSDISQIGQTVSKGIISNQMQALRQQKAAQDKINAANFSSTMDQIKFQAQNTGAVDPNLVSQALTTKPQNAEQIQNEITFGKYHHSLVQTGKTLTTNRLAAYIGQLRAPMSAQQVDNPNSFLVEQARLNAASALTQYSSQLQGDPAGAIENTPSVQGAIANAKLVPGYAALSNQVLPGQLISAQTGAVLAAKTTASITAQTQMGLTQQQTHGLSNAEAANITSRINATELQFHTPLLRAFINNFPANDRAIVLRDLQNGGLKESSQYLLNIPPKDQVQGVLAFSNTFDDYSTLLANQGTTLSAFKQAVAQSPTMTSYIDSLSGGKGDNTQQMNSLQQHATLLAMQFMQSDIHLSQPDAINQALTDCLGGPNGLQFHSFANNGQTYAVPAEVNGQPIGFMKRWNALDMMKNRILNSKLVVSPNYLQNIPGIVREGDLNSLIVASMHFSQTKDGTGLEALDQYGSPILNSATGQPFIMSYSDMANNNSQLSQDINTFMLKNRSDLIRRVRSDKSFSKILQNNLGQLVGIDKDKGASLEANISALGQGARDIGEAIKQGTASEFEKVSSDVGSFFRSTFETPKQ